MEINFRPNEFLIYWPLHYALDLGYFFEENNCIMFRVDGFIITWSLNPEISFSTVNFHNLSMFV